MSDNDDAQRLAHIYATPQHLGDADTGPIHVGWWPDPQRPIAGAQQAAEAYEDRLVAPLHLSPDHHVLDLGCGTGDLARRIARGVGCRVSGVDVVQRHTDAGNVAIQAEGLASQVHLHTADARALPFDDDTFDAAVVIECLVHLPDRAAAARELARVLRPGARVAVSDHFLEPRAGALARAAATSGTHGQPPGSVQGYIDAFREAGLTLHTQEDVTRHTLEAFYTWGAGSGLGATRALVRRTEGGLTAALVPLIFPLVRWIVRRGGWGIHFLWFTRDGLAGDR